MLAMFQSELSVSIFSCLLIKIPWRLGLLISLSGLFHRGVWLHPSTLETFLVSDKSFPFLQVEGELGLCQVDPVEGSPSLGAGTATGEGVSFALSCSWLWAFGLGCAVPVSIQVWWTCPGRSGPSWRKIEMFLVNNQLPLSLVAIQFIWQASYSTSSVSHSRNLTLP